jgi:hypothetical protein
MFVSLVILHTRWVYTKFVEIGYTLLDYESLDAFCERCARAKGRMWSNAVSGASYIGVSYT